jgi:hypothetical protein
LEIGKEKNFLGKVIEKVWICSCETSRRVEKEVSMVTEYG